jgi:cardiolipin synthase C
LKLDGHPDIEVRVYNPWVSRRLLAGKAVEFLFHIRRLNHRMHNKTYIADGRFAIIGGRNIGDRYFGLYHRLVQSDLDALTAGPAVSSIESSFDAYWNSTRSYPAAVLVRPSRAASRLAAVRANIAKKVAERSALLQSFPLKPADWDDYFTGLIGTFAAGQTTLLYDSPDSGALSAPTLYPGFKAMVASARREVLISSPYFVPDAGFRKLLRQLVARGVRVEVVTNSLATNNHAIAHTGYKHWRRDLLADGVQLYELREHAALRAEYVTPPASATNLGLHAKAVVVDRRLVFVGSPNIDPRSMVINTEIGVVVRSEELARRLSAIVERDMAPQNAWRVTLDAQGFLEWSSAERVVHRQPARGFAQRFFEFVLNLLPLKTQI